MKTSLTNFKCPNTSGLKIETKRILLLIWIFLLMGLHTQAQIVLLGNTHNLAGTGTGTNIDLGTNYFSFDFYSGPGGVRTIFRRNSYWYIVFTGLGNSNSANVYYSYRTVNQHPTVNPPDCVKWQSYTVSPNSPGYQWLGYPSSAPVDPNGSVIDLAITGASAATLSSGVTGIAPDYIDLATKTSSNLTSIGNNKGRILYNLCTESIQFNTGSAWKSVWPSFENYNLNQNQALNFGNANTQIFGSNTYGGTQLKVKINAIERIVLGTDPAANFSLINFIGSVSTPVASTNLDFIMDVEHHTLIHTGGTAHTVTLPSPLSSKGRQYIIANPSTALLSFTPYSIVGLGSSLAAGQNVTLVSDGSSWYKIN